MSAIAKIVDKLKFIESSQDTIIREIIDDNTREIELLNITQLKKGLNVKGKNIRPEYASKSYAKFKQSKNSKPQSGTPDLKLTGKYYSKMQVKVKSKEFEIVNTDSKDAELSSKYGSVTAFKGLTNNSKSKLRELILPRTIRTIRRLL